VNIWFDQAQLQLPQTNINENLKFSYVADSVKGNISYYYKANAKTEFKLANISGGTIVPINKMQIESPFPLEKIHPEKWTLKVDSTQTQPFTAKILEHNPYIIEVSSDFISGKKYELNVPKETVSSYFSALPLTHQFNFTVDNPDNYGSLRIKLKSKPKAEFWMQLLSEQNEVKYSRKTNQLDTNFDIVKPGRYYVRILVDNNGNGIWDAADFKDLRPAEDVYILDKIIEIRPKWENVEDKWDPIAKEEDPKIIENEKDAH